MIPPVLCRLGFHKRVMVLKPTYVCRDGQGYETFVVNSDSEIDYVICGRKDCQKKI